MNTSTPIRTKKPKITVIKHGRKHLIAVDGIEVAVLRDETAADLFRSTLVENINRSEAVYDTLVELGNARVTEIANALDMDRANVTRLVNGLKSKGRIKVVGKHTAGPGRPAKVYAAK